MVTLTKFFQYRLGNINVSPHFNQSQYSEQPWQPEAAGHTAVSDPHQSFLTATQPAGQASLGVPGVGSSDPLSWSMDLLMEDFPPLDDFEADQWFSFTSG